MSDPISDFHASVERNIQSASSDAELARKSTDWLIHSGKHGYSYNFAWMGRPVIQYPQDTMALQELVWQTRPDLIIDTGIAHGGSLILSAALLAMLDYADAVQAGTVIDPKQTKRRVLGIDIDIRAHNRAAIEEHPMAHRIDMIQGSSTAPDIIAEVKRHAGGFERIMVCLDSNHTHEHVLGELEGYAQLTTKGCYCVVLDTSIEDVPEGYFTDRPWGKGNNPRTAVHEYVKAHPEFEIDHRLDAKLQVTVAKEGYLRRIA